MLSYKLKKRLTQELEILLEPDQLYYSIKSYSYCRQQGLITTIEDAVFGDIHGRVSARAEIAFNEVEHKLPEESDLADIITFIDAKDKEIKNRIRVAMVLQR